MERNRAPSVKPMTEGRSAGCATTHWYCLRQLIFIFREMWGGLPCYASFMIMVGTPPVLTRYDDEACMVCDQRACSNS